MRRLALLIAAVLLAACTTGLPAPALPSPVLSSSTPSPSPVALASATFTPTHSPTYTPTHALSPIPTNSPTPTPVFTPTVERGPLAPGFSLTVYAKVPAPTSLAFGPDGRLYVASTNTAVYAVADRDADQRGEDVQPYAV